ncbi:MAG: hypothetical protein DHS20C01_27470 [marine bacterium B5-7]|nr:MAG: hypothetical protein DHS20C01_27470 [marine bacterium B5-7]
MAAFLLADVEVPDMQAYIDCGYIENVPKIAARYGGVYRARGGDMEVLEGDWTPTRMIIIEFPDMESLKALYDDPEYLPYREIRQKLTISKIVAVDGLSTPLKV